MGYQEKRTWVLFGSQLALYGAYFYTLHRRQLHLSDTLWLILALIVTQVVLQALLAATTKPERRDERDRAIESRAYRVGYFALVIALVVMIAACAHLVGFNGSLATASIVNTLLFVLAVAELSKLGAQVALYHRAV